jgi:hypothetical protein
MGGELAGLVRELAMRRRALEETCCHLKEAPMELNRGLEREILAQVKNGPKPGATVHVEVPGYSKEDISECVRLLRDDGHLEAEDAIDVWLPTRITRSDIEYLEKLNKGMQ